MLQKGDPRDIGHALQLCRADKRRSRHRHMIVPKQIKVLGVGPIAQPMSERSVRRADCGFCDLICELHVDPRLPRLEFREPVGKPSLTNDRQQVQ